jgi:serine/threonine protein kinase
MADTSEPNFVTTSDFIDPSWDDGNRPTAASDELVGTTLNGTYVVERILGEGGMGRVYLAHHTRITQKRVAIKVLREEYTANREVLTRFQREAEAGASVSHPNVITVFDVDRTAAGAPYLVCEFLQGRDLSDHLKRVGKLDVATVLTLSRQLCQGLAAAHASGLIHRDLKPQNIFLLGDFTKPLVTTPDLKILDFGLSRFLDTVGAESLTKTGYIMGTPAYMAPEQARGARVDQRVDVYGVGAILYTALTGRPPFEGDTPQATVLAVLNSEAPRPRSVEPSIPPEIELVLERAMSREPEDRYPNVLALEEALQTFAQPGPIVAQPHQPRLPSAPSSLEALGVTDAADVHNARPRLVWYLSAAVLLSICVLVSAVTGVELAIGYAFNRVELRLLLLAILGISLTPAVLWLGRIRQRVWDNSSRVLSLLKSVRTAVVAGTVSYGLAALGLRFFDDFLVRMLADPRLAPIGVDWPGWNLVLAVLALIGVLGMLLRRRLLSSFRPGWGRSFVMVFLSLLLLASMVVTVGLGLRWRQHLRERHARHEAAKLNEVGGTQPAVPR